MERGGKEKTAREELAEFLGRSKRRSAKQSTKEIREEHLKVALIEAEKRGGQPFSSHFKDEYLNGEGMLPDLVNKLHRMKIFSSDVFLSLPDNVRGIGVHYRELVKLMKDVVREEQDIE